MGFSRPTILKWVAVSSPGDLPDSGIEINSLVCPELPGRFSFLSFFLSFFFLPPLRPSGKLLDSSYQKVKTRMGIIWYSLLYIPKPRLSPKMTTYGPMLYFPEKNILSVGPKAVSYSSSKSQEVKCRLGNVRQDFSWFRNISFWFNRYVFVLTFITNCK